MRMRMRVLSKVFAVLYLIVSVFSLAVIPVLASVPTHYDSKPFLYIEGDAASLSKWNAIKAELPKRANGSTPDPVLSINKGSTTLKYPFNFSIWNTFRIVGYGDYSSVAGNRFKCGYQLLNPGDSFPTEYFDDGHFSESLSKVSCSDHGSACPSKTGSTVKGEWQYLGFDTVGNRVSNMYFRNDANVTKFDERNWIKEPWSASNIGVTKLTSFNPNDITAQRTYFNAFAYDAEQITTRKWINNTLAGWGPSGEAAVPLVGNRYDTEVYKYLYVQSAPTVMQPGSGRMWHQRPSSVWYQTISVPRLTGAVEPQMPNTNIAITQFSPESIMIPESRDVDDKNIKFAVTVEAKLNDENYYGDSMLMTTWYTRRELANWDFTLTTNVGGVTLTQTKIAPMAIYSQPNGNKGKTNFTFDLPLSVVRAAGGNVVVTVTATPRMQNNRLGIKAQMVKSSAGESVFTPADFPDISVVLPDDVNLDNAISEIAFDNIKFTGAVDNTDMANVNSVKVYVNGSEISYTDFFTGNYTFPRTTDRNGYLAQVDVIYNIHREYTKVGDDGNNHIVAEDDDWRTSDVVYVYPTTPNAHFDLTSNSFKANRKIMVTNDSPSANIALVMQAYPITSYRWSYGGDTSILKFGSNTDLQKELLYKAPGSYAISLEAQNTLGQWSDPYTVEFAVLEDITPAVELNLSDSVTARGEPLKAWNYAVSSTDGDTIASATIELWYDANNDGTVDQKLQTWNGLGDDGICQLEDFPIYTPDKLGYYKYIIKATEEFVGVTGQDTLSQYVTAADKMTKIYEMEWWVDNYQPMADLFINTPIVRPDVDVVLMLDSSLNDVIRQQIIDSRMSMQNWLIGKNVLPTMTIFDNKTYVYTQPASTTRTTGTSYPSGSVAYESNGYSGTLTRTSVSDNGGYQDRGSYQSQTETKSVSDSASQSGSVCLVCSPGGAPAQYSTSAGRSYSDSQGFSGYMPLSSYNYNGYTDPGSKCSTHKTSSLYYYSRSWSWSGTASRTVSVWVPNIQWISNYLGYYSGTIYKNVKQAYIDPFSGESYKYVLYISDNTISDTADFDKVVSQSDAKVYLAGKPAANGQRSSDEFFDTTGKDLTTVIDEMLNKIALSAPAIEQVVLVQNQAFEINIGEDDIEADTIVARDYQIVHDENWFDTPTGHEAGTQAEFDDAGWIASLPMTSFGNVGRYDIYYRVKDDPSASPLFDDFSYYSGNTQLTILVHRIPIADAILDWTYNTTTGTVDTIWVDKSYDWDHISQDNKGIIDRKIMFRKNGGAWQYFIPDTLDYNATYDVQYTVRDEEGAWSAPWIKTFTLDSNPQFAANARTVDPSFSLASIPASETLELYNIWTRQPNNVRLETDLLAHVSGLPALINTAFTQGVTGTKSLQDINWNNVSIQIPSVFPDGPRTLSISAVDTTNGARRTITFPVNVSTPINLVPALSPDVTLTSNQNNVITATTTKYPSTTTVVMQYGTAYASGTRSLTGTTSGNSKSWTYTYAMPSNVPDGIYTARFISTNPSGKSETRDVQYRALRNRAPVVAIYGTTPTLLYEGDDVILRFNASDPDLDNLSCNVTITRGASTVWSGSIASTPSGSAYTTINLATMQDIPIGSYVATVTATDPYGATASATHPFTVSGLSISGSVSHAPLWDQHRISYNTGAAAAGRTIRAANVFFPGENFILHADTTLISNGSNVVANSVQVSLAGTTFSTNLTKTGVNAFDGELWDSTMMNWTDRQCDFIFTVTYSNGTIKQDTETVFIVDDEYWRLHRLF